MNILFALPPEYQFPKSNLENPITPGVDKACSCGYCTDAHPLICVRTLHIFLLFFTVSRSVSFAFLLGDIWPEFPVLWNQLSALRYEPLRRLTILQLYV